MTIHIPIASDTLRDLIDRALPLKKGFDLLDDHVVITDADAHILYANKAAQRNTGFSIEEMLGRNPADLWGGEMDTAFYERMWQTIKTEKKPFVAEVRNKRKDGSRYWQELHISPVLDPRGEVQFFIGVEPIIAERKEKEKFRDEFISIIGHQLRNPLVAMRWTIDWLSRNSALGEEDKKRLGEIAAQNQNLTDLVADLLILSRISNGAPSEETFDLDAEIEKIIAEVKIRNPNVAFTFQKTGDEFALCASRPLAVQIFSNLIYNAAEYSYRNSGTVSIALKKERDHYLFSCENNGEPIPAHDQPMIFSKLFRASNAPIAKAHGTGLGLFLVKMTCDSFGWNVSFKSPTGQDGTGTAFFVTIPLATMPCKSFLGG